VTAFLHLLSLKDHHKAQAPDERPEKHSLSLEDDTQPLNSPTRADILGTYDIFVWETRTMGAHERKLPFLPQFCFETTSTLFHLSLYWERKGSCCYSWGDLEIYQYTLSHVIHPLNEIIDRRKHK
jgi:hypothetical protein